MEKRKKKLSCINFYCKKPMEWDKVSGFDAGADDYVTKPFQM